MQFPFALVVWVLVGNLALGGVCLRKYIPSNALIHLNHITVEMEGTYLVEVQLRKLSHRD